MRNGNKKTDPLTILRTTWQIRGWSGLARAAGDTSCDDDGRRWPARCLPDGGDSSAAAAASDSVNGRDADRLDGGQRLDDKRRGGDSVG